VELDVEDGLSGIVALMKMSESWLRCLLGSTRVRGDDLSEYGDSVVGVRDWSDVKDVSIGESIGRFARGEAGRPQGESGADIVVVGCDRR
jgi:hypothetical protein